MRRRARAGRRGARGLRRSGRSTARRSARSPTPAACGCCDGGEVVGDMPVDRARRRLPALRPRARDAGRAALPGAADARSAERRPGREALLGAAGLAEHRLAPAAVRAVRLRSCSRAPCAGPSDGRRRRAALCPTAAGASRVSIDGNGRRVAADPYRGTVEAVLECAANLACVGAEPLGLTNCLNFGNPEKPHIAWQLDRGGARPRRRLPRARRAGRRRQRLALQRGRRRADLPDAGRRHGRRAARRRARRPARASRSDGDAIAFVGPVLARRCAGVRAGQAARRAAARRRCPRSTSRAIRAAHAAIRDAVRAGALSQRPRHRRGRLARRGRRMRPRRRPRRGAGARRRTALRSPASSAKAPGGSSSRAPRTRCAPSATASRSR